MAAYPLSLIPDFPARATKTWSLAPRQPLRMHPDRRRSQCGWYTEYGDLIVTGDGTGVYVFPADGSPNDLPSR